MTASAKSNENRTSLTVNDHFAFFKLLFDRANDYYVVQKVYFSNYFLHYICIYIFRPKIHMILQNIASLFLRKH